VRWHWETKVRLFGFEGGANARRWSAIASRAWEIDHRNLGIRVIMLRTPELPVIPLSSWTAVRQKIEDARGKYLDIYVFSVEEIAQIHAARTLMEEAIAGDIPFPKKKALDFIHARLRPLWEKLKAFGEDAPEATGTAKEDVMEPPAPMQPAAPDDGADIAARIEQTYASFNLAVKVVECVAAPQILRFRLQPAAGVRVVSLVSRAQDLQIKLALQEPPKIDAAPGYVTVDVPRPASAARRLERHHEQPRGEGGHGCPGLPRGPLGERRDNPRRSRKPKHLPHARGRHRRQRQERVFKVGRGLAGLSPSAHQPTVFHRRSEGAHLRRHHRFPLAGQSRAHHAG